MGLIQELCKHKKYEVKYCDKTKKFYGVKCLKCGKDIKLPKAEGEMYMVGQVITRY